MKPSDKLPEGVAGWSEQELSSNPHDQQDKSRKVEEMFTSIAESYDLNNRVHSMWRDQAWRKQAVKIASMTTSDDVVDVACGTGDVAKLYSKEREPVANFPLPPILSIAWNDNME